MEEVIILPRVGQKLKDLALTLFHKEYFGFMDYVGNIENFIHTNPMRPRYPTNHNRYGKWYCKYRPNKNTTWFITFDTDGELFVIKNIINNHTRDYPDFIKSI